jgi:hypothetical protein
MRAAVDEMRLVGSFLSELREAKGPTNVMFSAVRCELRVGQEAAF